MSDELCASYVKSEVEELIKSGEINKDNWENMSIISKLVSAFQQAHEKDKFKRPKVNKFFNAVLHTHFSDESNEENENENEESYETKETNENQTKETNDDENDNDEVNQLEKETVEAPKSNRRSGRRGAGTTKSATIKATKTTSRSSTTNEDSRLKYSMCKNLNIDNPYSTFNISNSVSIKDFPNLDADIDDAEDELVKHFTTDEIAENYTSARDEFIDAVSELRKKYPVVDDKGKEKPQKFTIVKSKNTVRFINPETKKQDNLPKDEQNAFTDYQKAMDEFDKKWKDSFKPVKIKSGKSEAEKEKAKQAKNDERLKILGYLLLQVVRTQNIIKVDELVKYSKVNGELVNKTTNTVSEQFDETVFKKMEDTSKYKPFAPDYGQLFIDIKNFNGSNYGRLCKNIYNHREPIVKHEKLSKELKKKAWLQAYSNIKSIEKLINIDNQEQRLVYDCWENVLASKYAYKIVMSYLPACELFKKSFEMLIQHPLSIKLYESALYPISFVFTPNMLGKRDFEANINCFNKTPATYKKNLQIELEKFGLVSSNASNYNDFNWLYYFDKSDIRNQMITLLHQAVALVDAPPAKKSNNKTSTETETETETDDE